MSVWNILCFFCSCQIIKGNFDGAFFLSKFWRCILRSKSKNGVDSDRSFIKFEPIKNSNFFIYPMGSHWHCLQPSALKPKCRGAHWSHRRPVMPGLQWHWPESKSHTPPSREPRGSHSQGWQPEPEEMLKKPGAHWSQRRPITADGGGTSDRKERERERKGGRERESGDRRRKRKRQSYVVIKGHLFEVGRF